ACALPIRWLHSVPSIRSLRSAHWRVLLRVFVRSFDSDSDSDSREISSNPKSQIVRPESSVPSPDPLSFMCNTQQVCGPSAAACVEGNGCLSTHRHTA